MSQDNNNNSAIVVRIDNPYVVNKVYVDNSAFIVKTGLQGPPGYSSSLMNMVDLDTSDLRNGSVILFDRTLNKFKTSILLEEQIINAGQY